MSQPLGPLPGHRRMLPVVLLFSLWMPATAPALSIDDFEEAAISEQVTNSSTRIVQQSLTQTSVIYGKRDLFIQASGSSNATITAALALTSADDALVLTGSHQFVAFSFYASSTQTEIVDLTEGGTRDRFRIEVPAVQIGGLTPINLSLSFRDPAGGTNVMSSEVSAAGAVEYPFSLFTGDPAQAVAVTWIVEGFASSISIGAVSTVPEPSSSLLLAAGIAGLALWRRAGR
jgi:hypothetical protein